MVVKIQEEPVARPKKKARKNPEPLQKSKKEVKEKKSSFGFKINYLIIVIRLLI